MTKKLITRLTSDQEVELARTLDYWLATGRSIEPLDRAQATEAICAMYQAIGKDRPTVLFLSSPAMCLLAWGALRESLKDKPKLRGQLGGQLWGQLGGQLGGQLRDQLWGQLGGQLWGQLRGQLGDQLRDQLWGQLGGQLGNAYYGSWWCAWEVFYDFCNRIGVVYTNEQKALLAFWLKQSQHCHWWFPYDGIVFASERPSILEVDPRGRLHSGRGAALEYRDGYALYAWHGIRVEKEIIVAPETITVSRIDAESNAEIRRILIERYGQARYLKDSGAKVVHELPGNFFIKGVQAARLLCKEVPGDEPIVMVDLLNSTPEPDGTTKRYMLRVDPRAYDGEAARDCLAAVASTWRNADGSLAFKRPQDYRPGFES